MAQLFLVRRPPAYGTPSSAPGTFNFASMSKCSKKLYLQLHRENQDPSSFLLNRNAQEGSGALSNQLLQQMNYQLHLQEQELALRKAQLERAGLSSISVASLGRGPSSPDPLAGAGAGRDRVVPQPPPQPAPETTMEAAGTAEVVFANSSSKGTMASRSTSIETTPSGKVFYFPCRARGMEQGHNFEVRTIYILYFQNFYFQNLYFQYLY